MWYNRGMGKRMTASEFIEKATNLHNGKYDYSQTVYVNSRTKVTIICSQHGPFEQLPSGHLQGNGCPKCARIWSDAHKQNLKMSSRRSRGMTTEEWIERAKQVHGDKYDYSQTVYVNQRTNVKIICPVHGLFEQKADSHIRGNGCRLCGLESEKRKGVHSWSDEQREKTRATCLERYGAARYLDSDAGKSRMAEVRETPEFRQKMKDIISSDDVQEKTHQTCLDRYGVPFPMQLEETVVKVGDTKRKNGTWSKSKSEEKMYQFLCDRFGKDDVKRQYRQDARYPFHCDFYIPSRDLFIELNATWLHGGHWFDETNPDDVQQLQLWKDLEQQGKRFYGVAIDVWTVRDVKKRKMAEENGLNYLVFWDDKLSDFLDWLSSVK